MRLGLQLGYDDPAFWVGLAEEADRAGFHSVWTSEAYGSDAVSPLAWVGGRTTNVKLGTAIMQMPARSPATTAATAATLDLLSGGRVLLGLGTSGPQVAEGWHGQAWGKPLHAHPRVRLDRPHDPGARGRRSSTTAPTTTSRTRARTRRVSGSRSRSSSIRRGRTCRSTSRRSGRRTSRSRPRSPTAGCRSSSRPSASPRPTGRCSTRASSAAEADPRAGISRRTCPSSWPTTSRRPVTSSSRCSRSTSAGWARRARTSTTGSPSATASRRLPRRCRISSSKERRARPRPPSPTRSSTRSRSSATAPGSPTASPRSARAGVTTLVLQARQPEALRLLAELV